MMRIFTLLTVALCSFLFTNAQERLPQFLKHKVKPGETITSIAELYNVNKTDLLLLNDFPEEVMLTTNQIVLIRMLNWGEEAPPLPADYKEGKPTSAQKKTEPEPEKKPAPTEVKKEQPVEVKKEQPTEVKKEQPVAVTEKPAPKPAPSTAAPTVGPDGTVYKVTESNYHIVEKGQTFYRIALIYGLTLDELKALNGLTSTTVAVGQKLRVKK
ncbi:MAG: LysM peptidoglycan-binding domain-containing protein [Chitinophagales bacterium]|nr:LysM peptidoglycan-binding domain-containing protein [Chitinophagales bacterium]